MKAQTTPPQQIRIVCNEEDFARFKNGEKTFEIKLTDPRTPVREGDLVTLEERNAQGALTGASITKKASCVVDTAKAKIYAPEDVAKHGLSVIGFVNPDYATLPSIFDSHFVMSLGIDRRGHYEDEEDEDLPEELVAYKKAPWVISAGPNYVPAHICPPFAKTGMLDSLNVERWPEGRYSLTMMIYVDFDDNKGPPYDIHTTDAFAMTYIADPNVLNGVTVAMLDFDSLVVDGRTVDGDTYEKVVPLDLPTLGDRMMDPMTAEEAHGADLLTEDDLLAYIAEARARGEDVDEMERELAAARRME